MSTLLELKKRSGLSNAEIGCALQVSASTASAILHGKHISVISDEAIQKLASVLSITFDRCWLALQASANETYQMPDRQYRRASEMQMEAEMRLKEAMPDLGISVSTPWPLTVVDANIFGLFDTLTA